MSIRVAVVAALIAIPLPGWPREPVVITCPLDSLLDLPMSWHLTQEQLEEEFQFDPETEGAKGTKFRWITKDKDRALFLRRPFYGVTFDLSLFGGKVPVEEAVVDFDNGKINGITFSVFNRGDAGTIQREEFETRFQDSGREMSSLMGVRPFSRKSSPEQGLLTEGYTWISENGMAALEYNAEAMNGKPEFLRLRAMRRNATGAMAATMSSRRGAAVKLSELTGNVQSRDDGSMVITEVPMVDQGPKGYCVVASVQRLFEYYGIPCDQHQLAAIIGTTAMGTDPDKMVEALDKIDHRFKTHFEILKFDEISINPTEFGEIVKEYTTEGIPLLWALEVGQFPEDPPIAIQSTGFHMRLIIGYNEKTDTIFFSDSWGAGHEEKRMKMGDAFWATHGLFSMKPRVR